MSRQRLGKSELWFVLGVLLLAILECGGKDLGIDQRNKTAELPDKACFIFERQKLPPGIHPDNKVTCLPRSNQTSPPIPDLLFEGVKYSSIDFRKESEKPPTIFAFKAFEITDKDGRDRAAYLKKCVKLYDSMWMSVRSLGVKDNLRLIRQLEAIIHFIKFQIIRLEGSMLDVELALDKVLKKCFECGVQQRYNLIALASQNGVDPDEFLKTLPDLKCKSRKECIDLLSNNESKNSTPLDDTTHNHGNFVTLNPAANSSSVKNFNILLSLFIIGSSLSISCF